MSNMSNIIICLLILIILVIFLGMNKHENFELPLEENGFNLVNCEKFPYLCDKGNKNITADKDKDNCITYKFVTENVVIGIFPEILKGLL